MAVAIAFGMHHIFELHSLFYISTIPNGRSHIDVVKEWSCLV